MKLVTISAILAFGSGLIAAFYWYKSSAVNFPGSSEINLNEWIAATAKAIQKSASLNKTAALWTAISVLFGGLSAFLGG